MSNLLWLIDPDCGRQRRRLRDAADKALRVDDLGGMGCGGTTLSYGLSEAITHLVRRQQAQATVVIFVDRLGSC